MILLDTDIVIDVIRRLPVAMQWLEFVSNDTIAVSGFTAIELLAGCQSSVEQRKLEQTLARLRVVWPPPTRCQEAFENYRDLHLAYGIGVLDVFIGQTALELGLPLQTFNVKHFQHIPGLMIEQPYERPHL